MAETQDADNGSTRPIVSIGMPVYNGERYLSAALDGVLAQSYRNFVLRISDNGSTDATPEILARYAAADPRIEVVRQSQNLGAVANFRYLLDRCDTPFFAWAAADDVLSPDWLERLLPLVTAHRCLAFGTIITIGEAGEEIIHPANGRSFEFRGPPIWRRLRYFLMPGIYGKANPIYGVFPRADLNEAVWRSFADNGLPGDVAALHTLLAELPVICDTRATLFKRRHRGSAAVQPGSSGRRKKGWFRTTMLPLYWRQSTATERALLVLTYPGAALAVFAARVHFLALRTAKGRSKS